MFFFYIGHIDKTDTRKGKENTYIICDAHVDNTILTNVMKKIASMRICHFRVVWGDLGHDGFGNLSKIASAACILCKHCCAASNNTVQDRHDGGIGRSEKENEQSSVGFHS